MPPKYMKATIAAVWALAILAIGFVAGMTSMFGWTVLASVALIPPIVMLRLWRTPPQTMSESVQEALR